jgi:hypothetical protein
MHVPTEDEDVKEKLCVELEHVFNQFHRNHMKNVIKSRNQGTSYTYIPCDYEREVLCQNLWISHNGTNSGWMLKI